MDDKPTVAVFVDSFDGYSDLWDIFWNIFDIFWSDCAYPKYLVTNEIEFVHEGVKIINTGKEINWFNRTINALEKINEDYIIFFLEDYFPSKDIQNNEIYSIVNRMNEENVFYYRLSPRGGNIRKNTSFLEVAEGSDYPITLQLVIWEREIFIKILKELKAGGCESPWDFEFYLKNNYKYCPPINGVLSGIRFDTRDIIGYKNGVLRGKWFPDVRRYYEELGIDFSKSKRDSLSFKECLRYKVMSFISHNCSKRSKQLIKNVLLRLKIRETV